MFARLYASTTDKVLVDANAYAYSAGSAAEVTSSQTLISLEAFSGDSVTIKMQYRAANGANVYTGVRSRLLLMEVQA